MARRFSAHRCTRSTRETSQSLLHARFYGVLPKSEQATEQGGIDAALIEQHHEVLVREGGAAAPVRVVLTKHSLHLIHNVQRIVVAHHTLHQFLHLVKVEEPVAVIVCKHERRSRCCEDHRPVPRSWIDLWDLDIK